MAQAYDIPEKLIAGKEDFYVLNKLTRLGIGKGGFSKVTLAEYARCCTPENIHAVCEDYRAAVSVDMDMDTADFEAGRRIGCPAAVYWGELSHTEKYFKPREACGRSTVQTSSASARCPAATTRPSSSRTTSTTSLTRSSSSRATHH